VEAKEAAERVRLMTRHTQLQAKEEAHHKALAAEEEEKRRNRARTKKSKKRDPGPSGTGPEASEPGPRPPRSGHASQGPRECYSWCEVCRDPLARCRYSINEDGAHVGLGKGSSCICREHCPIERAARAAQAAAASALAAGNQAFARAVRQRVSTEEETEAGFETLPRRGAPRGAKSSKMPGGVCAEPRESSARTGEGPKEAPASDSRTRQRLEPPRARRREQGVAAIKEGEGGRNTASQPQK
jgi:hypothetical protein